MLSFSHSQYQQLAESTAQTLHHLHFIAWAASVKGYPKLVAGPQRIADGSSLQVHVLRDSAVFPYVAHMKAPAVKRESHRASKRMSYEGRVKAAAGT
jgi:hypothetical protein